MDTPSVAVVIPTHNRSTLLRRTLDAVAAVEYSPEPMVVVVDDGSAPEHSTANRAAADAAGVTYLTQTNAGPATARNRGVAATSGDLVVFLDDDCAPDRDWLNALTAPFSGAGREGLGGVGGRVVSAPPHNWVSRFCADAEYITGIQPEFTNAITANACFRRAVFDELDGFDEEFRFPGGEDPDFSRRVRERGYQLQFVPDAVVYHAEIETFREFFRRVYRRGLGEAVAKRRERRVGWLVARNALFPLYALRRARQTWRVTATKAGRPRRLAYAAVEAAGAVTYVVGSLVGLVKQAAARRG